MRLRSPWSGSAALLLALALLPAPARAQWTVIDPTNLAQNLAQVRHMAEQIVLAKRQLEYHVAMLQSLRNPNWRHLGLLHEELAAVVREGEALGYSLQRLEAEFDRAFPGYAVPRNPRAADIDRMRRTLATMRGVLRSAGMQARDAEAAQVTLARIKGQMAGLEGTQQALELQATIQGLQADELGALRQQLAAQTNADAVWRAHQLQREMEARAARDSLVATTRARPVVQEPWDARLGRRR